MNKPKLRRGFAAMTPEKRASISSKGGKSAHAKGAAHQFTPAEARRAGQLGGWTVAQDRRHMARIGAAGGRLRGKKMAAAALHKEAMEKLRGEGQQHIAEIRESIRAEKGEFGKGAIIKDGKVIKSDVDAMDAMEHFREGIHGTVPDPDAGKVAIEIPVLRRHNLPRT